MFHHNQGEVLPLFETEVALDFVLTSRTVHLWSGCENNGLDVLGKEPP